MKKLLAGLLSMILLLSLSVTSFAAEAPDSIGIIGGADGPTAILTTSDLENVDLNAETQKMMLEMAKSLLPYPDGVNVWANGAYMTFTDAAPVIKEGRTQVPFRAILEALGAVVSYDNGNIEAVFPDGGLMKLAIGSTVMTYQPAGEGAALTTVQMDVAPYIDYSCGRTYVPVRFIGETLGLTVTWNAELKVAYIVDWDALTAQLDANFTEINALLALAMQQTDPEKSYKTAEKLVLAGILEGQSKDAMELILEGESITKGGNMSGAYTLGVDAGGYKPMLEAAGAAEAIAALDGQKIETIINAEQGIFLRSGLVALLSGGMVPENGWLGLSTQGMDVASLVESRDITIGSIIRMMCEDGKMGESLGYMAPDMSGQYMAAVFDAILGNDAVKMTGSESNRSWTVEMDLYSLLDGMVKSEILSAQEADETKAEFKELGFKFDMTLKMSARKDKITKQSMTMELDMDLLKMDLSLNGTGTTAKGTITLAIEGAGQLTLKMDSKMTETKELPLTAPAEGEPVIAFEEILNAWLGQLQAQ